MREIEYNEQDHNGEWVKRKLLVQPLEFRTSSGSSDFGIKIRLEHKRGSVTLEPMGVVCLRAYLEKYIDVPNEMLEEIKNNI